MNAMLNKPKTLQDAILYFSDPDNCLNYMVSKRWPNGASCPRCGRKDVVFLVNQRKWQCKSVHAKRQFSAKVGTIFEDSPLGLDKWLTAMWMLANCKNGVSSYEIHRAIGVTQKSAWFMMHRIRLAMKDRSGSKLGGGHGSSNPVEVDETFIGGKVRNMHRSRRTELEKQKNWGLKNETKTIVAGGIDRVTGKVQASIITNRERNTLDEIVRQYVKFGSTVYTDDHIGYMGLRTHFTHEIINKSLHGYILGKIHTQGIENFWSLLKRGLSGTYVAVEPAHLSRYVDEQVFRFNNRKDGQRKITDAERFETALSQVLGRRLTFAEVTGKVGEEAIN